MIPHTAALLYEVIAKAELPTTPISRHLRLIRDKHGQDMDAHHAEALSGAADLIEQLLEERAMPLKPRVKVKAKGIPVNVDAVQRQINERYSRNAIPIGSYDVIADAAGKMKVKPKRKAGATLNQQYANRNRKRYRRAK